MPPRKKHDSAALKQYVVRASKNLREKRFDRVVENCSKAIKLDPSCVEAYFLRGEAYNQLNEYANALQDLDKAIELRPNYAHAFIHRAFVYKKLGRYDEALSDLRKAPELEPGPESELTYLFNAGTIFALQEKYRQALKFFTKSLKLTHDNSDRFLIFRSIGMTYSKLNKQDKALENFDKALILNPNDASLLVSRAITYESLKQNDKALKDLESACVLEPKDFFCHINKGIFLRITGKLDQAVEEIRYAIELNPQNYEGYFQLGLTYELMMQYDMALEQHEKARNLKPEEAHIYTHIGIVYANLRDYEKAVQIFSQAIKLDPEDEMALLFRGSCYLNMRDYRSSLKDFEQAIVINSSIAEAYLAKGQALCFLAKEGVSFRTKKKYEMEMLKSFEKACSIADEANTRELAEWWIKFSRKYCDSSSENKKRLEVFARLYEASLDVGLFSMIIDEQNRLSKLMSSTKTIADSECYFQVLRRWNSFTPAIPERSRSNLGGGYILVSDGHGIVIDPGYNFIENFVQRGFSLADIGSIILTHAHDDHTADFEAMLSLLNKTKTSKKINLFVNLGASVKFSNLIANNETLIDQVEILNEGRKYEITQKIRMEATKAKHKDILTEESAKGLIFELRRGRKTFKVGLTGDTALFTTTHEGKGLPSIFENMDVLVLHIGSIQRQEFECLEDNFENQKYEGGHLGIRGIVNLILRCRPKLAVISEFGEELKQLRTTIAEKIDNRFENFESTNKVRVIPGDIGLKISFDDKMKVRCEICGDMIEIENIHYTETLINHKIAYHCGNHSREEIIATFRKQEEKELRTRAESMGCAVDLGFRLPPIESRDSGIPNRG